MYQMIGEYLSDAYPDGGWLVQDDGNGPYIKKWSISSPQPTEAEISAWSFGKIKAKKRVDIRDRADTFLAEMAVEYGAYEKLTWDQQAAEASALFADPETPAPLVRSIATARNMNPLELAARIRANHTQWIMLSGSIVGQRLAYQDALDAAQTVEEIGAIVPVYGLE